MHEYSVVSSLITLCEEHAKKNQAHKIERVVVGIGERSGMDKSLFVSAFETFREESQVCKDAILDVIDEKIELECKSCSHVFKPNTLDYGVCEKCQGKNVRITQGNEMRLLSLEMLGE
ncbi:hydrogenase/urease nickel incorporation protein HypA [Helicobacter cetorum]|uniref:Hydrogenase maturation factor HypA n=1 Tax=Helicobacter cetorum (strain ATCC BAA-429 / MIT 00-7128) TaxID=182217 RepID=I0EMV6_HELC0|nr:hydrogenase/urease nickel incorporation protein HypA [Helicobacter cetorum]AFI04275.1 hydrogenase nickel incorporation protein [Helicobacter cetorum MIT 00-7128]